MTDIPPRPHPQRPAPNPAPPDLRLTLVQEGVGGFDQQGCPALMIPVSIEKSGKIESHLP